ncbi:hypothetical protein F2Q68_00009424 [Brassica cretica]|uniref:Uncharacterized protein n=1 Tax=Brassica cretica TaxID=69181 RepID=A0A8S9KUP0_BRACR|nr:hypothetical protein F2Q68_00009424 [Brassica cretica]
MAMGVSFTSHSNPLLRHLSPAPLWVSHSSSFLLPCRKTLQRRLASTEGGSVWYSTSTVCHGFQNPVHQRPSSVVFNGEWILLSEPNRARMVPKTQSAKQ